MTQVSNNKRIAKNTLYLYIRMLLMMVLSLYTSRVVLKTLGIEDFGIYNIVGGIVAMLGFLTGAMANAVQRFLSFELGKTENREVNEIFNVAITAHLFIAIIVFILAETLGYWFIANKLNVPIDRLDSAIFVFHCSILTAILSILQVPYNAIIIANEKMEAFAYISIIEGLLKLLIVYCLLLSNYDRLKMYAVLTMMVSVCIALSYIIYSMRKFPETKFRIIKDFSKLKEITGFALWNMLGELSWVFTGQGVNIILNLFFGPAINAARGLAEQVSGTVMRFVNNFQIAVNPQLIKQYANNDYSGMKELLCRSTRFSFYLLLFLSLPIIIEMDYILNIWLKEVPNYTGIFCRLILVASLCNTLSNLLTTVARAYGHIRNYQIVVSCILFLNFPLSYLVLYIGGSPVSTMYVYISISVVLLFVRLEFAKKMIGLNTKEYFISTLFPILKVTSISYFIPYLMSLYIESSFLRLVLTVCVTSIVVLVVIYSIGLNVDERNYIISFIQQKIKK